MASPNFGKALQLHRANRFHEALALYETSDELKKAVDFESLYYPALAYFQTGNNEAAGQLLLRAISVKHKHPLAAHAYLILGNIDAAARSYESALSNYKNAMRLNPNLDAVRSNMGGAYIGLKRYDEALDCFSQAIIRNPKDFRALSNRASALTELARYDEAITACEKAIAINAQYAPAYNNKGICEYAIGRFADSIQSLYRAIELDPRNANSHFNIGKALTETEMYTDAIVGFRTALSLNPEYVEALSGLATVYRKLGDYPNAITVIDQALALQSDYHDAKIVKAEILADMDQAEAALTLYEEILTASPALRKAYDGRALLLQELGRSADAAEQYEVLLQSDPTNLGAQIQLAILAIEQKDYGNDHVEYIIRIADEVPDTDPDAIGLHFALGKIFDRRKEFDRSFFHYHKGNSLKRVLVDYNAEGQDLKFEKITNYTNQEWMTAHQGSGFLSRMPIFVLGMPRSGTTLTETILSRHPAVHGAGELGYFSNTMLKLADSRNVLMLDIIPELTPEMIRNLGEEYVSLLSKHASGHERVSDKNPGNFRFLGLIKLALPHAKIIHIRRNPIDTCLSNFEQNFGGHLDYSYNLKELGRYYRGYDKLMNHWRSVLEPGSFMDLQYEDLVSNPNEKIAEMLAFCELDWHEDCLNFSESDRRIKTASIHQVRKGLYQSSVEKWRRYEKHLGALIDALGDLAPI